MSNYFRVVRLALRRRWTLVGIVVSSLLVAVMWGANIGTIYPFVEVVFDGQSMHQWVDESFAESRVKLRVSAGRIAALEKERFAASPQRIAEIDRAARLERARMNAEHDVVRRLCWIEPAIERYAPRTAFTTLVAIVGFLLVGTLVKSVFLVANIYLVERLAQLAVFDLRRDFYRTTLDMDVGAFGDDRTTNLTSRLTHDMGHLAGGLNALFGKTLREPLKMLACLAGAAYICPRLLLLSLVITPVAALSVQWLSRAIKRASRRAMEEMTQLYAVISETFIGIEAVKAFTMERYERHRFHEISKKYLQRSMRIVTYNSMVRPITEVVGIGVVCVAILAGGSLVLNQETHLLGVIPIASQPLERGALITFFAMLIGVSDPARKLADVLTYLQRGSAAADRVYEMLDRKPTIVDGRDPRPVPHNPRELVFDQVSFHYLPNQPVLDHVSLTIPRGKTVAIVGPNGCGKSTLVNLLPRFYDPVAGTVRLGDVDIRQFRLRDLRRQIGLVTQRTLLFDDTIMNNIRYGSPSASDDEVIAAAERAHADAFIRTRLDKGYHTIVGESGGKLSGGQRQRIALARAILRDPAILILDEATSQVDLESEQLIHLTLREFVRGRTTLMITHRVTTLELADEIAVMDAGRVIDFGAHETLIQRCELYRRLYNIGFRHSA